MKDEKKASLYTSASLNGAWLLISIDTAIWLHKQNGFREISVYTIPRYSPFNIFGFLLRFKNLTLYLNKAKLKKILNFFTPKSTMVDHSSELARFAVGQLDNTSLIVDDLNIHFFRIKLSKKNSFMEILKLSFKVIIDYFNYFTSNALREKKYLNYKLCNIYVGLNVLSEALRSDYKSFGSIFHCRIGILNSLYKLNTYFEKYKDIILKKENSNFVIGPAQTYIYGCFSKFMFDKGACFIDTSDHQMPFIKRELKDLIFSHLTTPRVKKDIKIPIKKISDYYKNRINNPWQAFSYLGESKTSKKKVISLKAVSVIVYLHSFTDAQYFFGYDGYHDLMDWSLRTISLLNSNKYVDKVIIKPHPATNPFYHPGDVIANDYLKAKVSRSEKVMWVDFHFDVNHIKSTGVVIGITHHGSVAEELVFHNFPVIASSYSYWGKKYKFGYCWDDLKEYETLISSKSITELKVTKFQTQELYRYAFKRHLSSNQKNSFNIDSTWQDFMKINDIKSSHEHGKDMEQVDNLISRIEPKSIKFQEYINTRVQRLNLLNQFIDE